MSTDKRIYFFGEGKAEGDPTRKDVLGGKGSSLAAMTAAGLPVPPGFTISVECCRLYHENGGTWPEGLEDDLRENLARLVRLTGWPFGEGANPLLVSVRSGAAVSMPGMMDTLLNCGLHPGLAGQVPDPQRFWEAYRQFIAQFGRTVADIPDDDFEKLAEGADPKSRAEASMRLYEQRTGKPFPATPWDALVACVNAVFESWNNERAITYRKSQDIRGVVGTAVSVQSMFPSEVSGIAFTANPADPFADEVIIESSYGLGEAIVSGMVAPDLFVLDRETLHVKQRTLGSKSSAVTALEGPSRSIDDPSAFSLTDDEVTEVARLAVKVEGYYGYPIDIEWGLANGRFSLLQARAVRGLDVARDIEIGRDEEIRRLKALVDGKRKVWVIHNLAETLPAPTPLTWDIMRGFMSGDGGFGRMYHDFGYHPSETVREHGMLELICGRIYMDPDRAAELFWGNTPLEYDVDALIEDPSIIETAPTKFNANRADGSFFLRLPKLIYRTIHSSRLMKRARRDVLSDFQDRALPPYLDYVERKRREDLTGLSTSQVIDELHERIDRVLTEFGKESLKPGFFGGVARAQLETYLVQLMGEAEGRVLVGVLTSGLSGDTTVEQNVMLYHVAKGERTLDDFLERFGHRTVGEMELAEMRWREDPSYLETMMGAFSRSHATSPEERHETNEKLRSEAERILPQTLAEYGGSSLREEIETVVLEAQALLPYREIGKHYLMMGYETVRQTLTELSRRWDLGRDVFFLRLDELRRFEDDRDSLIDEIARRKVRWQSARRLFPADVIDSAELDTLGSPRDVDTAGEMKALPMAPGIVEGTVHVVFSPGEAGDLGDDAILVCPSTDPGWTALFVTIRGLIVERGGVLSHGAITARDFGIPAVACHDATRTLEGTRRVRVDGSRGTVTILDEN